MSKYPQRLALAALLLLGTACGRVQDPLAELEMNSLGTLIKQSGDRYPGTRTISIRLLPPLDGAYQQGKVQYAVQAAHRWVQADIHHYELQLALKATASVFVPLATLSVDPRVERHAVFANLKPGETYQVMLLARGEIGGAAPTRLLNVSSPTRAEFRFASQPPAPHHQGANMQAALDPTPIDPRSELAILPASEGAFQNVADAPTSESF